MDNVRVIPDAGDVEIVGADTIAKLSAETSEPRSFAAWDQRIVIQLTDLPARPAKVQNSQEDSGASWRRKTWRPILVCHPMIPTC